MLNYLKNISPVEWGLIAVILIVFLGSKTVTRLGKTGGQTLKEIKNIKKNFTEALDDKEEKK